MKIRLVGAELVHRQTDMTKLIVFFAILRTLLIVVGWSCVLL